ncbi:MAG: protein-glutamate O-methyltransferase CheR [Bacteroidetes bacterium]|nr:protein-glutamate O-methyltransferase CheR [Bacteroidota bacterium]MBU1718860.1 protein-glutamate O-methyltransferase CheR [Bacteroidota bacterium]
MGSTMVTKEEIARLIDELKNNHQFDFSNYAEQSFSRRIDYVLTSYGLDSVDALLDRLRRGRLVPEKLVNDITVNTTELFRDPEVWINLKRNILPILKKKDAIGIWHAGCSSGEEVYSMLILLAEAGMLDKTRMFATDINTEILEKARAARYNYRLHNSYFDNFDKVMKFNPLNELEEIKVDYAKYFDLNSGESYFQVKQFLKNNLILRQHNLLSNNIFYKFDLIFCRNVIIYFNTELQNRVIQSFWDSMFTNGMLLLGSHESLAYLPIASKFENKMMRGCYLRKDG